MLANDWENIKLGYDVLIIGAGPAGCTAAANLSEKYKVLLVDELPLPRTKACGGVLVSASKEFLSDFFIPDEVFESPKELNFQYLDLNNNLEKFEKKGFFNVSRTRFDAWLLSFAQKKENIDIVDSTKFVNFSFAGDKKRFVVYLKKEIEEKTIIANYILDGMGPLSSLRERLGASEIKKYICFQELLPNPGLENAAFLFDDEITDFYSWIIPKSNKVLIGSALEPPEAKAKYAIFKKKILERFKVSGNSKVFGFMISRPSTNKDVFLGKDKILLMGEAAGLISPSSGEGMSFAMKSGKNAAAAINESPENPYKTYAKLCEDLKSRVIHKFAKSEVIKSAEQRMKLFG